MSLWLIGLLCVGAAVVFSGLLALKQLGVVGESLPGCGPQSACGALTSGPFGRIPGIDWPVSYVGVAWFLGLLVAWLLGRRGLPQPLVWLVRVGALASLGFVLVMVAKGQICPYCLGAHIANFIFWIIVECTRQHTAQSNAFAGGIVAFMLATILLAGGQIVQSSNRAIQAAEEEDQLVKSVLSQSAEQNTNESQTTSPKDIDAAEHEVATVGGESETVEEPAADPPEKRNLLTSRWVLGDPEAPVNVVMFSDYSCPDCKSFEDEIQRVLARRGDVSLSVRHFPMCTDCNDYMHKTLHANACWAARSAEAAGILGGEEAFWEMHRWLFEHRGKFPGGHLPPLVEELGFDPLIFQEVMMSDETLQRVRSDIEDGVELGLFFTPMIFVNGVQVKWQLLQTKLTPTVDRIADAIASGQATAERAVPPVGVDRLIEDWRDGRPVRLRTPNRIFRRPDVPDHAPRITMFVDFASKSTFVDRILAWEEENGPTNLTFRFFPINHDCNSNLSDRIESRPGSCLAAKALVAAGIAGSDQSHYDMAWWLLENGSSLGADDEHIVVDQAASMGIDPEEFRTTLNSAGVDQLIANDAADYKRKGFRSVPAIIVEGRLIPRLKSDGLSALEPILDEVVETKQSP